MKNLAYLSERQRKELIKVINDEAEAIIEAESEIEVLDSEKDGYNDKDLSPPPSKKSQGEHKLLEFLGNIINPEDQEVTLTAYEKARIEVKRYQDATVTMEETHEGPFNFKLYGIKYRENIHIVNVSHSIDRDTQMAVSLSSKLCSHQ